jgi:phage shock protein PspC (stress-responsive transcriptional regulator)
MNKVIAINLGGNAYQLEESGYDALRDYLENAAARLAGNPDREEIISDIEQAIADKFRALLGNHKTVVLSQEVAAVLAEMGPIESEPAPAPNFTFAGAGGSAAPPPEPAAPRAAPAKRLYRIYDGAMISGVCNGIAAYLHIDPTLVRLAFVFLTIVWGTGLLIYILMVIVVPEAHSPEEKAAASGDPSTAQEFIRRAKEGYYAAMKGFPDRQARREWHRRFKRNLRANADQWKYNWHGYWAAHLAPHPGMSLVLPILSLLQGAVTILWVCALISLLATGAIFGLALPANVPPWAAAIILLIACTFIAGPLKLARRALYWGMGQQRWSWSFVFLLDALIWVAVAVVLLLLAVHHFPELRDALHSLPTFVHQAANDFRDWWQRK